MTRELVLIELEEEDIDPIIRSLFFIGEAWTRVLLNAPLPYIPRWRPQLPSKKYGCMESTQYGPTWRWNVCMHQLSPVATPTRDRTRDLCPQNAKEEVRYGNLSRRVSVRHTSMFLRKSKAEIRATHEVFFTVSFGDSGEEFENTSKFLTGNRVRKDLRQRMSHPRS